MKTCLWMGFCVLALLTSCSSDPDDSGASFHPDYKKIEVFVDSSTNLKMYSVLANRNFVGNNSVGMVGYVQDLLLGSYKSSMIGIASPLDDKFSFEDSVVVTKLNLNLEYFSSYGDKKQNVPVSIYELLKDSTTYIVDLAGMPDDESSLGDFWDEKDLLISASIPGHGDSIGSETYSTYTIDLLSTAAGRDLADRLILTDSAYNTSDDYNNIQILHEYMFKGIYIQANTSIDGSSMIEISNSSNIELGLEIYIYDKESNDYTLVEETINFSLNKEGLVNVFDRKYKPEIEKNIYDTLYEPSQSELDTVFYLHRMHGISGRVVISELDSIFNYDDHIVVNHAELSLYLADEGVYNTSTYPAIDTILMYSNSEATGLSYLGRLRNSGGTYSINMASHINEQLSKGEKKIVLDLIPYKNEIAPNRSVFRGVNNPNTTIQLKMTYTKFNID